MDLDDALAVYLVIAWIVGFVAFLASWAYCIFEYGFLLGAGIGWFPSMIVAYITGLAWPLVALAVAGFLLLIK